MTFRSKFRPQTFFRQQVAIADHTGEGDFTVLPLCKGAHVCGLSWAGGCHTGTGTGDEGEWHTINLCKFRDVGFYLYRLALALEGLQACGVAHAPQTAPDHLLAEELRAKGTDPQDVSDCAGVPTLGEHGNRNNTAHLFAQFVWLANGVHHLA